MVARKGMAPRGAPLVFIQHAASYSGEECLTWPFATSSNGYGHLYLEDGTGIGAARRVCEVAHGRAPTPKHETAHSCGNGHLGCVNKNHLRWATHVENIRDKLVHDTHSRGERHTLAKLTTKKVLKIVVLLDEGKPQRTLAAQFGVSKAAIQRIHEGRSWGWLTERQP